MLLPPVGLEWYKVTLALSSVEARIAAVRTLFWFFNTKGLLPAHPAVQVVENFLAKNIYPVSVSDVGATNANKKYLDDLEDLPEALEVLDRIKKSHPFVINSSFDFSRRLGKDSLLEQLLFPASFGVDVVGRNTTRALLGSFGGKAKVTQILGDTATVTLTINNDLTWESLTRFPPMLLGYEGRSVVPHQPGWQIPMKFEWRKTVRRASLFSSLASDHLRSR